MMRSCFLTRMFGGRRLAPWMGERDVQAQPGKKEKRGGRVEEGEHVGSVLEKALAQGKDHEKVQEQGREGQEAPLVQSVEDQVERRQLAGRRKDHERGEGRR